MYKLEAQRAYHTLGRGPLALKHYCLTSVIRTRTKPLPKCLRTGARLAGAPWRACDVGRPSCDGRRKYTQLPFDMGVHDAAGQTTLQPIMPCKRCAMRTLKEVAHRGPRRAATPSGDAVAQVRRSMRGTVDDTRPRMGQPRV